MSSSSDSDSVSRVSVEKATASNDAALDSLSIEEMPLADQVQQNRATKHFNEKEQTDMDTPNMYSNQQNKTEQKDLKKICMSKDDKSPMFLSYLRNGLPQVGQQFNRRKQRVIIVGAGLSGLTAAKLLKDAGYTVIILEASSRIGGRVQTYRDKADGWYCELGAMRFPDAHIFTNELVHQFGLKLQPFSSKESPSHYFVRGKRLKSDELNNSLHFFEQEFNRDYNSSFDRHVVHGSKESLKQKAESPSFSSPADMLTAGLRQPIKDLSRLIWRDFVKKYDKYSLRQWLIESVNISHSEMDMLGIFFNMESYLDLGMIEAVTDECIFLNNPVLTTIDGGMDHIPNGFHKFLGEDIRYNSKVTSIKQLENGVQVDIDCKGIFCTTDSPHYMANYVIVTPPPPIITGISFVPDLLEKKRHALRTMYFMAATKVILVFHRPFWVDIQGGEGKGGSTITDLQLKVVYYPVYESKAGIGVLLASYTWGSDSMRLTGMTDDEVVNECLQGLAKIHQMDFASIRKLFRTFVIKRWATDHYTLGAFANMFPFQQHLKADLGRREGRIFFAGEHTEVPHGWIDTVIKSGIRAATELHLQKDLY